MLKELLRDTKLLTSAGSVVIALALIWLIATKMSSLDQALNANASALSANTAVVTQFQSLLLQIQKSSELRSAIMSQIVRVASSTQ